MSIEQLAIDTASVTEGMYVSRLDRPWLETPFVFQGFEVREKSEIDMLREYCQFVYVDIERGNLSDAHKKHLLAKQGTPRSRAKPAPRLRAKGPGLFRRWLESLFRRLGMHEKALKVAAVDTRDGYPIRTTVRAEAEQAREAYRLLAEHHEHMVERARISSEVDMVKLRRAAQPAVESVLRNPNALAWTVFARKLSSDDYNRSVGTAIWCLLFGRQLGFDRSMLDTLAMGGMLLDIGNARLPPSIAATGGAISSDQFDALKQHVELGLEILACSEGVPEKVHDMVRCHHERVDGSGYPRGLRMGQIPAFGRIAAIADCYDAMTTISPYSEAMAGYDAARALNEMRGREFPAEVVEQFLATMGMFPVASVVELNDGSVGTVLEQNPENVLKPKVMVLLGKNHERLARPRVIEMRDLPVDITQSGAMWIVAGHEHGAFGIDPLRIFDV